MQEADASKPRKAPPTKVKRALMAPKQLCPTGANIQTIESKANLGEQDVEKLSKWREVLIKKSREYRTSFPKYNGDSKKRTSMVCKYLVTEQYMTL